MAKNKLIGSNLYISPMNNTGLYIPPQMKSQKNQNYNISSEFYPSVDIS